ncbi:MAG: helix-turn-helix transcriptional regulator [Anaerolineae bacterium]|nr:helix-turn-helix transcriptional regulator [Anaerolineae bacterium]
MNIKGSLPLLILHVLSSQPHHGYEIAKQINLQSGGLLDFRGGTLYPTLHTLEQEGLIESYTQEENGRLRRYYQLREAGRTALLHEREEWSGFVRAVNQILEGGASI